MDSPTTIFKYYNKEVSIVDKNLMREILEIQRETTKALQQIKLHMVTHDDFDFPNEYLTIPDEIEEC